MRKHRTAHWIGAAVAAVALPAAPALADEPEAAPELALPAPQPPLPSAAPAPAAATPATEPAYTDDANAVEAWQEQRPWRYGTDYLFALSRGMGAAGIPRAARWPLYLFTVPSDVALLPFGAIAGLYGSD